MKENIKLIIVNSKIKTYLLVFHYLVKGTGFIDYTRKRKILVGNLAFRYKK